MEDERGALEAGGDFEFWQVGESGEQTQLSDLLNRVLDRGVVLTGHVTISIADVDLVHVGLSAVLTSASRIRRGRRVPEQTEAPEA